MTLWLLIFLFNWKLILINSISTNNNLKWQRTTCGPTDQITQWGREINSELPVLPEYPRPQLVRGDDSTWINLNGLWEFQGQSIPFKTIPFNQTLNASILVPFPAESCLSGIGETYKYIQYRTLFSDFYNRNIKNTRVLLHFGAIDWQSNIYINGKHIGNNTGGYHSFHFDITNYLNSNHNEPMNNELIVSVYDPSDSGVQPNGKQRISAITNPGGDTYTPSSGIWQTVWLEQVPTIYISHLKLWTSLDTLFINITISGNENNKQENVTIIILDNNNIVSKHIGKTNHIISMLIHSPKLWTPNEPFLYNLQITLQSGDSITSYFGIRTYTLAQYEQPFIQDTGPQLFYDRPGNTIYGYPVILEKDDYNLCWYFCNITMNCLGWSYEIPNCQNSNLPLCYLKNTTIRNPISDTCYISGAKNVSSVTNVRPLLNNQPLFLAGWLDQSFWPDGIYTAPTDDALKYDLFSIKRYGLNMVRLHQKVNNERWYYYADQLGILVWQDQVQKYGGATNETIPYFMSDLYNMVEGKYNHPSIVQWETFNEGDCVNVFPNVSEVVSFVQNLDPTRLVDTDSGGPANDLYIGNVNDVHNYPYPGDPLPSLTQYAAIGEFGGIGAFIEGKEWVNNGCYGYKDVQTTTQFADLYINMTQSVMSVQYDVNSIVYTQITDVEEECDGMMTYDRTDKFDANDLTNVYDANQNLINAFTTKMQNAKRI